MVSFFTFFDGYLMLLALALFLGTLIVIYLLLSRSSNQRRVAFRDRRRSRDKFNFPFYDCEYRLVKEERRLKAERRKGRAINFGNVPV